MPAGDATANRLRNIALALVKSGLKVAVVGRGDALSSLSHETEDGISYHLWYAGRSRRERVACAFEHYWGGSILPRVKNLLRNGAQVIICNHGGIPFLHRLFKTARKLKVQVVMDVTEWWWWLRPGGIRISPLPLVIEHVLRNRYMYPRPRRLIAVSRALSEFYRARGCTVFCLPPLLDLSEERWQIERRPPTDGALHILFSGSPDRERWDVILEGLFEANRRGTPVVLELLGVAPEHFARILGAHRYLLDRCGTHVCFHGRLPYEEVLPTIASAHFGILVRDDAPWSRGCFPSKVPEFLALGVPVVFTPSSDLDEYLQDGVEGLRIGTATPDDLAEALTRAWSLVRHGHWDELSRAARLRARTSFDRRAFGRSLRSFLGL